MKAISHKSVVVKTKSSKAIEYNNEKLEFIGDAIMNYLIAKIIIERNHEDNILSSKILHEKKTSVINNLVLALILVENDLD